MAVNSEPAYFTIQGKYDIYIELKVNICDNVKGTKFDGLPLCSLCLSVSVQNSQA